jgi:endonuclease YncB( thermonuclease family)
MKASFFFCTLWAMTLGFLLFAAAVQAEPYSATVIAVPEGDVLSLDKAGETIRVRLWGIDAPEPGQPFADEALAKVKELVLGKAVKVDEVAQDSAGMPVAKVSYGLDSDLGETLVAEGLAWWDRRRASEARALKMGNAEALLEKKGLWAEEAPLAPWDYRLSHDLEDFTYEDAEAPVLPASTETPEEEIKSVSASGTATKVFGVNPGELGIDTSDVNVPNLLVRHMPRVANDASGNPQGITATDIGQIPFAKQLGFQDGDVVTNVNGVAIRGMQQVPQLIQQFRDTKQFNVTVMRGGQPVTLNIQAP